MGLFIDIPQPFAIPPYWKNHPVTAKRLESLDGCAVDCLKNAPHICALGLRLPLKIEDTPEEGKKREENPYWELPIDPVITVSCRNEIVKRNVLKVKQNNVERRGSVKELWTQGDYEISISGVLINNNDNLLPDEDLRKLRAFCEHRGAIEVQSPLFTIFNITKICIESYDFPFTKGMENQMYSIKAVSDDFETSNLLIAK